MKADSPWLFMMLGLIIGILMSMSIRLSKIIAMLEVMK